MPRPTIKPHAEMTEADYEALADWVESDEFAALPAGKSQDASPLRAVASAQRAIDAAEEALVDAVAAARAADFSWTWIGTVLGVSRQAARQRFVEKIDARMHGLSWNRDDDR
jgi:hypothetical protein